VEAVVVQRIDRIELVDLYEVQSLQDAFPAGIDSPALQLLPDLLAIPAVQEAFDFLDEVFPVGSAITPSGLSCTHSRKRRAVSVPNAGKEATTITPIFSVGG
jgi:hypothetical protein